MFTLAFHIVAIGILAAIVWSIAYGRGVRAGERRLRRLMDQDPGAAPEETTGK